MRNFSRAVHVTSFALAFTLCVPAAASPNSAGQADALTDGLLLARSMNSPENACDAVGKKDHSGASDASAGGGASRDNDRLRNAGPVNGAAPASRGLDAGMKQLEGQDKIGNTASMGRGVDIARVDGEIVSPGNSAASGLPTSKRQHGPVLSAVEGPVTVTGPVDKGACP